MTCFTLLTSLCNVSTLIVYTHTMAVQVVTVISWCGMFVECLILTLLLDQSIE